MKILKIKSKIKGCKKMNRPNWDEYFIEMLESISKRATCDRGKNSAILVKNKRILATGYVGSPVGLPHCDEAGHLYRDVLHTDGEVRKHCVRTTHAEANAIANAARFGVCVEGSTLYTKMFPCLDCTKLLINAGITRIVVKKDYHASQDSKMFLDEAGIKYEILEKENEEYENQK